MAKLVFDRICKSFGKIKILKNVSFDCNDGEFLTIVGPSGSGKTTVLNCIAGLVYPEKGTIIIGGDDATLKPPQERDIAMAFGSYALYPRFSVYKNLAFPLRSPRSRMSEHEIEQRVTWVANCLTSIRS